ncbi:MAG: hypothetical protein ACXWUM_02290 [Burkholderiaceae bacterium]
METSARAVATRDFRKRYGDEIADIAETHGRCSRDRAHRPAARDVKAKLQAILAFPDAAGLQCLDSLTHALLMDPAWRRFRIQSLNGLTQSQLAECARYALDHFPPSRKPVVERAEVLMTLALLDAARDWHAARRITLVRAALSLVFRANYVRATAIIRKAHGELRDTARVRPPSQAA